MTSLQENFLGKKIRVIGVDTPFEKNVSIIGICTFIGFNELLNKHQVTIDRMPICIKNYDQVSLNV